MNTSSKKDWIYQSCFPEVPLYNSEGQYSCLYDDRHDWILNGRQMKSTPICFPDKISRNKINLSTTKLSAFFDHNDSLFLIFTAIMLSNRVNFWRTTQKKLQKSKLKIKPTHSDNFANEKDFCSPKIEKFHSHTN